MKADGGAKRNASLEQRAQVSMATQRAATTARHVTLRNSVETLTSLYTHLHQQRGRGKLPHKGMICSSKELHNLPE